MPGTEKIEVPVEAVLVENPDAARYGAVLMGPEAVRKAGLAARPNGSVWRPDVAPDRKAQQRAEAAVAQLAPHAQLAVERGYQSKDDMNTLALGGFAVVVVLGAAAVATGLAAADSRNDRATLAAVGAPPRMNRIQAGLQCTLIAGIGAVLGTVSGFVPALGLLRSHTAGQLGAPHGAVRRALGAAGADHGGAAGGGGAGGGRLQPGPAAAGTAGGLRPGVRARAGGRPPVRARTRSGAVSRSCRVFQDRCAR